MAHAADGGPGRSPVVRPQPLDAGAPGWRTRADDDMIAGTAYDDVTSVATIPAEARGTADLGARVDGVVAGLGIAEMVFRYVMDAGVSVDRSHVLAATGVGLVSVGALTRSVKVFDLGMGLRPLP